MIKATVSENHRKELLRFLLLKTAAVRSGIKPGALLRVQHCYQSRNSDGFQFCLYRNDILEILKLDHLELQQEESSSLILFYHRGLLAKTLQKAENRDLLERCHYRQPESPDGCLKQLKANFSAGKIPHEVGVFIGYPAKDVLGFIENLPKTPIHKGDWQVFGDAGESLSVMNLYRKAERLARSLLDACEDLQTFLERTAHLEL